MFNQTFRKLSTAFTTAINAVQDESGSGVGSVGKALMSRLEAMRGEIGEQNDQVERTKGDAGGLYAD